MNYLKKKGKTLVNLNKILKAFPCNTTPHRLVVNSLVSLCDKSNVCVFQRNSDWAVYLAVAADSISVEVPVHLILLTNGRTAKTFKFKLDAT